jgi:hypothetical protein
MFAALDQHGRTDRQQIYGVWGDTNGKHAVHLAVEGFPDQSS